MKTGIVLTVYRVMANGIHITTFEKATEALYSHHLLPVIKASRRRILYQDSLIETPVRYFRVASLEVAGVDGEAKKITGLFVARHRDELAVDAEGRIINPKMCAFLRPEVPESIYDPEKINRAIDGVVAELPLSNFSMTCLIRYGEGGQFSRSNFIGFRSEVIDGKNCIFLTPSAEIFDAPRQGIPNQKRVVPAWFPLNVYQDAGGAISALPRDMDPRDVRESVLKKFHECLQRITEGRLPLSVDEMPHQVPVMSYHRTKAGAAKIARLVKRRDWKTIRHDYTAILSRLVFSHVSTIFETTVSTFFGQIDAFEPMREVEKSLHPMLDNLVPKRGLVKLSTGIVGHLFAPIKKNYRVGWRALCGDALSDLVDTEIRAHPSKDHVFAHWLLTNLLSPYVASVRCHNREGHVLDLTTLTEQQIKDDVALIRIDLAKGITLHYETKKQVLYAQYTSLRYAVPDPDLPADAADYFQEGKLVRLELKPYREQTKTGRRITRFIGLIDADLTPEQVGFVPSVKVKIPKADNVPQAGNVTQKPVLVPTLKKLSPIQLAA